MDPLAQEAKEIFIALVDGTPEADWERAAEQACQGNALLHQRVRALLAAHAQPDSRLDEAAMYLPQTVQQPVAITEQPGTIIGRYKLLEQIGEGGFGVVFMAEQQEPVQRKVALKILKPGMDTKEVIARFEAERQALAILDHPNIAKVLDAGSTDSGRPFFVMELVRGMPITTYCDHHSLTMPERLELFVSACQAVQHAHQKGIIHRDIKPSNILVTLRDDQPIAKVIDFGVAKATNQRLTEKTVFTQFAQMVGTPLYMSPEQAGMSELETERLLSGRAGLDRDEGDRKRPHASLRDRQCLRGRYCELHE
jgi:serine/threonine protein kinase